MFCDGAIPRVRPFSLVASHSRYPPLTHLESELRKTVGGTGSRLVPAATPHNNGQRSSWASIISRGRLDASGISDGVVEGTRRLGGKASGLRGDLGAALGKTPRDLGPGEHSGVERRGD